MFESVLLDVGVVFPLKPRHLLVCIKKTCMSPDYNVALCLRYEATSSANENPCGVSWNLQINGTRSFVLYREVSFIWRLKCTGIANRNWNK